MSKIDLIVSNVINSVNNFLGEHHNESLTDAQKDNLRWFVEALPGGWMMRARYTILRWMKS